MQALYWIPRDMTNLELAQVLCEDLDTPEKIHALLAILDGGENLAAITVMLDGMSQEPADALAEIPASRASTRTVDANNDVSSPPYFGPDGLTFRDRTAPRAPRDRPRAAPRHSSYWRAPVDNDEGSRGARLRTVINPKP